MPLTIPYTEYRFNSIVYIENNYASYKTEIHTYLLYTYISYGYCTITTMLLINYMYL